MRQIVVIGNLFNAVLFGAYSFAVWFGHIPPPENVAAYVAAMLSANMGVLCLILSLVADKDR